MKTSFPPVTIKMPVSEDCEFVTVAQYTELRGCDDKLIPHEPVGTSRNSLLSCIPEH
jgi:hypothetical protein